MTADTRPIPPSLRLLTVIVDRGRGAGVAELLRSRGLAVHWILRGRGTAKSEMMAYLGLDEPEKDLVLALLPTTLARSLLGWLCARLQFDRPGHGIAFLVHPSSINAAMVRRLEDVPIPDSKEADRMEDTRFELIVAVAGKGTADVVMDGARREGATGGTVLRGRGLGLDEAESLMHLTFHPEKELVLILVPHDRKGAVMKAISEQVKTECGERIITFSLAVDDVAGLTPAPDAAGA